MQPFVDIRRFIPLLKHTRGDFAGRNFLLEAWQDAYLNDLFNTKNPDGTRQYRTSLLALPRKNGKALALDTPVRTTAGWKTMGEIAVGDSVFHPSGRPTRVIVATDTMEGRPCYAVAFSQGDTIVADADHFWLTNARIDKPGEGLGPNGTGVPGWRVRTTREIAETCFTGPRKDRNHGVSVCGSLEMPEADLAVDPYILGVWLGDGGSDTASVTVGLNDPETIANLIAAGTPVTVKKTGGPHPCYLVRLGGRSHKRTKCRRGHLLSESGATTASGGVRCRTCENYCRRRKYAGLKNTPIEADTIHTRLRQMGLLDNKHIPSAYLSASVLQRQALMQGLMDSDGHVSARSGQCEFCSTSRRLADGFLELVVSLGLKASMKESDATLRGRVVGRRYRITFTPTLPMEVFRLSRKQARVKPATLGAARSRSRQIISCEPTPSVPVRCIQVESPDGMFVVGRSLIPTHNSQIAAAIGLYMAFCDDEGAEVIVAAGDRSQASILHDAAKQLLESCPALARKAKVYRNSIVVPSRNAKMLCISSEAGTKHGYNPSCALIDEYHVFPDRELVDVLETGMGARKQPLTIYITTAGTDMQGPCYKDWKRAEKIRDGALVDPTFLPCIFAADPADDPFDEATWKKANPNYGVTLKPEYFHQFSAKAQQSPSDETVFRTLHLNQWMSSTTKWLKAGAFENCAEQPRPGGERMCYCGIDLASTFDTTAFVAIWPDDDGTYDIYAHFFIPEENAAKRAKEDRVPYLEWAKAGFVTLTEGDVTDYDVVRDHVLAFCEKNAVRGVAIDRYNATHLTTQLDNEGVVMKPFGQGFVSMNAPTKLLETLVIQGRLRHGGNPVLQWQASNVQVKTDDAGNVKPTKKNSSSTGRIDGMVALIMALGIASGEARNEPDEPMLMVF
jgi:phage terminase large subunit-like protein